MSSPLLHELCEPFRSLLGTWKGRGEGHYPSIESFEYVEEATFNHVGKPFIAYVQKTRDSETNAPLHSESGYIRPQEEYLAELVLAQPSGIVEIHKGSIESSKNACVIYFESIDVRLTPSAKEVTQVSRLIKIEGDTLSYDVSMAAVGEPFQHHLKALLKRQV